MTGPEVFVIANGLSSYFCTIPPQIFFFYNWISCDFVPVPISVLLLPPRARLHVPRQGERPQGEIIHALPDARVSRHILPHLGNDTALKVASGHAHRSSHHHYAISPPTSHTQSFLNVSCQPALHKYNMQLPRAASDENGMNKGLFPRLSGPASKPPPASSFTASSHGRGRGGGSGGED